MAVDSHMANSTGLDEQPPGEADASSQEFEEALETGACDAEGASVDCRIRLPTMDGTKNCFVGTQVCLGGEWSSCMSDEDAVSLSTSEGD
jgi:hypothetical protein